MTSPLQARREQLRFTVVNGQAALDGEWASDHWDASRLGIPARRGRGAARFDGISQPWLRALSFIALMNEAAGTRDYAACLAVLTVAEWLYLDWASRAPDPLPADPIAREWIELHDNPEFAAWVAFLRAELDRLIPALTPPAADRCARFFAEATRLERAFFDAVYSAC